ncbi:ATP-dependent zinc metalloprotease FtsH [Stratiformator vulcanicus]|uniref:ATP-dependent zinc metalloprotease FtsH n=1 Tax=Stratiformator vulcanicus TaxID=2527980 RepID=A0A517R2C6_9PLAN|nr:ATP-dependent zinc metalloprotease FtsH [Stratiformator vulcanicus]QDT38003.1 ATP-dependent zinc metalloprotease FtsH [Stratiformator vulcanicus]
MADPRKPNSQPPPNSDQPSPGKQSNGKQSDGKSKGGTQPEDDEPQRSGVSTALVVAAFVGIALLALFGPWDRIPGEEKSWSEFLALYRSGEIAKIDIYGKQVAAELKPEKTSTAGDEEPEGEKIYATAPNGFEQTDLFDKMTNDSGKDAPVVTAHNTELSVGTQVMLYLLVPFLIFGFLIFMMRRASDPMSGGGMLGNFVRSPAKRFRGSETETSFDDVAGMDQAKAELEEVVDFLKSPAKFQRLGATIPKGVLLMGSPGTGKTLLARATAGEAGVPFFSINGSEFIQMFVGVGASRVRDMFKTAKEAAPCILFIDEVDAIGRERGAGLGGGHDEREQTLNQILSEMDGFTPSETVIVMAATNRPDILDPALLRPGRFDRHITVDKPNKKGREGILKVHVRKVPLADTVDLGSVAASTIGFSGAELRNLVNEAALLATRKEKSVVEMDDFDEARDKVLMGPQREDILGDHERRMTAYHEAGHALLAWLLPTLDPVYKVTIVPRGRSLGLTQFIPEEEQYNIGERKLHDQLTMILGGRAAEKLIFDETSAGAEDDIRKGTQLARRMVARWGMSDVIGPVSFRQGEEHPFLGKEMQHSRDFSEDTARQVDQEIQRFMMEASERATQLLDEHHAKLDAVADALLEHESIGKQEMISLLGERDVARTNGKV